MKLNYILLYLLLFSHSAQASQILPENFVYLKNIDPSILQDIRYAGFNNFTGVPVTGYEKPDCILTLPAALALKKAQKSVKKISPALSLIVYDCYRPQQAVNQFILWSQNQHQTQNNLIKNQFYPHINKSDLFRLGYIAARSGHTRGSTVDLSIYPLNMGTHFDYLDPLSGNFKNNKKIINLSLSNTAIQNRLILKNIMQKQGFMPYSAEWWHFTLKDEPYPETYFDFPVR